MRKGIVVGSGEMGEGAIAKLNGVVLSTPALSLRKIKYEQT
jgi:hypothetical protein